MDTNQHLQVVNLSCVRQHKKLFSDFSFTISPSELLLIEGPNGSGKSSLLRLLSGLATPFSGAITWQGESIYSISSHYRAHLHYIGHTNGIKLGLTVAENLQLASHLSLSTPKHIDHILETLQLQTEKHKQAHYLSAGQKRRLALAKLFLYPKTIWILDEPLTTLDIATQEYFLTMLSSHLQQGGMAIVSSHHLIKLNNIHMQTLRLTSC